MECGGNDAALAGHVLGSSSAEPPSPEAAERGWQQKTLGQMVDARIVWAKNGYADGGHNESGVGIPHLRPFNVSDNGEISLGQIKSVEPPPPESPHRLRRLDVIFNNTNSEELVGKTALFDSEGAFVLSNHMTILRVLRGQELDPAWLARALHLKWLCGESQAMCRRHVNQASISLDRLRSVELLLPPLPEQQAIASVLRTVQGAKEACERVLAATRQLKQSLLHHLFTYGPVPFPQAAHVPLKETEVGSIPEHWSVVAIRDIETFMQYGTSSRCESAGSGLPVLRIPNVVGGRIDTGDLKYLAASPVEIERHLLQRGDLLFVRTNGVRENVGRCAVYLGSPARSLFASYLIRARLAPDRALPEFVQLFTETNTGRASFTGRASGAADGKFNINTQTIRSTILPLPPLPEQREIVEQVSAVHAKLAAEESRRAALAALFQSLLHHLMTGQVRVPLDCGGSDAALASRGARSRT
jgi:type I restriction enzyme S subunit